MSIIDETDAYELAKIDIYRLIQVLHKELKYWLILKLFLEISPELMMQADAEYWLNQGK